MAMKGSPDNEELIIYTMFKIVAMLIEWCIVGLASGRSATGLKVDHTWVTRMWPTYWSFLYKSIVKWHGRILMKQCHWFLCFWQDKELVPCTDFLRVKSLDTTCFKTAWGIKLILHQWWFSTFTRLKVHSLIRWQCYILMSMRSTGHIQII